MNSFVSNVIDKLIGREGGYFNHTSDLGGPTRWGITQAVARAFGYDGDMRDLPREKAVDIYHQRYWLAPGLDRVALASALIAEEMFDTGVNMGPARAVRFLQRALNALNRQAKLYPDIAVDGRIGPITLAALRSFLAARGTDGETVLMRLLNAQQAVRYLEIAEGRRSQEDFMFGWVLHRVGAL